VGHSCFEFFKGLKKKNVRNPDVYMISALKYEPILIFVKMLLELLEL